MGIPFQSEVWKGYIKIALLASYEASTGEEHTTIHKKPEQCVTVTKSFSPGKFELVALSNNVTMVKASLLGKTMKGNAMNVGKCFKPEGGKCEQLYGVIRSHLTFPKELTTSGYARTDTDAFVVPYWACGSSLDQTKTNATTAIKQFPIQVGSKVVCTIAVPIITNTKALKVGDVVLVLKAGNNEPAEDDAPAPKKHKAASVHSGNVEAAGNAKGNDKGKGKPTWKK